MVVLLVVCDGCGGRDGGQRQREKTVDTGISATTPNLYQTDKEDTAMNRAIATAKAKFGNFEAAFKSGGYEPDLYTLKVRFPSPDGNEYIWLTEISKSGDQYQGVVSDTPRMAIRVKLGDTYTIPTQDIVDWMYGKDSVIHGAYTTRVILSRMSKEERAEAQLGFPYKIED